MTLRRSAGLLFALWALPACGGDFSPGIKLFDVTRRDVTGDLDAAVLSDPGPGDDRLTGGVVDLTSMYTVGTTEFPGGQTAWRIEKRRVSNGALEPSFDGDGIVETDLTPADDRPRDAIMAAYFLYIVGDEGGDRWRIEKRSFLDGALDPGFGTGGAVQPGLPGGIHSARATAADGSWLYVVGGHDEGAGNGTWRIEKRSLADGALDAGWIGGGRAVFDAGPGDDRAVDLALDSAWIYVLGTDANGGNPRWLVQKRSRSTGAIDPAFGGGTLAIDPGPGDDRPAAILEDSGWLYVLGTRESASGFSWHLEKRNAATGAPAAGFGAVFTHFAPDADGASAMILIDSTLYLSGTERLVAPDTAWRFELRDPVDGSLIESNRSNPGSGRDAPGRFLAGHFNQVLIGGSQETGGDLQWRVEKRWK